MLLRTYMSCLVTIPNLALPSHYIPRRFSLTGVNLFLSLSFDTSKLRLSGLSLIYLGQMQEGMAELQNAASVKATDEHGVIDEAIRDQGEGYTVFSIVCLSRPLFLLNINWIRSPSGFSTDRQRTSSGMPRHATFWAKL